MPWKFRNICLMSSLKKHHTDTCQLAARIVYAPLSMYTRRYRSPARWWRGEYRPAPVWRFGASAGQLTRFTLNGGLSPEPVETFGATSPIVVRSRSSGSRRQQFIGEPQPVPISWLTRCPPRQSEVIGERLSR